MFNHNKIAIHTIRDNNTIKIYCPAQLSTDAAAKLINIMFPNDKIVFFMAFSEDIAPEMRSHPLVQTFGNTGYIFAITEKPRSRGYVHSVFEERII